VTGSYGSSYTLAAAGGTQVVTPTATATYTAKATSSGGNATATVTVTVAKEPPATVTISAGPTSITAGASSTLTVTAAHATAVSVTGSDGSSYTLTHTGGTQIVTPATTTNYTAEATSAGGNASATATVTATAPGSTQAINHVIFMMQENHTFDNYFGMLNPYRHANHFDTGDDGNVYNVDGIDDKLNTSSETNEGVSIPLFKFKSSCIDPSRIAPISAYYTDLTNGTLPSFTFIEPGYGITDEHPGSFQPVLLGQQQMAKIINAFMASPEWKDGVFFFSYDEGGGPYDHVPPVPHHSND
jgi:phospholipase C